MFNKICIIGFGLIGSSLARIIRRDNLARELVCVDASAATCEEVIRLQLADTVKTDPAEGVKGADLVILAVPVGACADVASRIGPVLAEGAIVTDVGSVKQKVIESVMPHMPPHAHFVPGHPIAGTENSGPAAGFPELFEGRWCILTPLPETELKAVEKVTALWESGGARIEIMDARRHDLVLGITSHLPHLIAYTIVGTATDLEEHMQEDVIKFSASGFRDFTRIAASDPTMWRDIFLNNKEAVLEIIQRFSEDLTALQKAIRWDDGDTLFDTFTRTRQIRRAIVQAGQADYRNPIADAEAPPVAAVPKAVSGSEG